MISLLGARVIQGTAAYLKTFKGGRLYLFKRIQGYQKLKFIHSESSFKLKYMQSTVGNNCIRDSCYVFVSERRESHVFPGIVYSFELLRTFKTS